MSYKIVVTRPFDKQLKHLIKKYPSLKKEIVDLFDSLGTTPFQGAPLGKNCYKIRISISSKGKGKRGGARVITHIKVVKELVYLLLIYDKAEQADIDDNDLDQLLQLL